MIFLVLAIVFFVIQFIRPEKNKSENFSSASQLSSVFQVPGNVEELFKKSCYDCHSNKTNYPWYSEIQPVGWWLANHVNEGKKHFNFDEFAKYSERRRLKKIKEIKETIQEEEMPLSSYTFIHTETKLSEADKQLIIAWCDSILRGLNTPNKTNSYKE